MHDKNTIRGEKKKQLVQNTENIWKEPDLIRLVIATRDKMYLC